MLVPQTRHLLDVQTQCLRLIKVAERERESPSYVYIYIYMRGTCLYKFKTSSVNKDRHVNNQWW